MQFRIEILAVALTAVFGLAFTLTGTAVQSQDLSKFPDWKGQWVRIGGGGQFDSVLPQVCTQKFGQTKVVIDEQDARCHDLHLTELRQNSVRVKRALHGTRDRIGRGVGFG